jgi:HSP20 family protein
MRDLTRAEDELARFFSGMNLKADYPQVDVWVGQRGGLICAQIPGVDPEQLDITVYHDTVTIQGRRDPEYSGGDIVVHRRERLHGAFTRSFAMPFMVDSDNVSARFDQGVLTLELPRPEQDMPRQIKVTSG